jgi:small subunit ribosomal protein S6
MKRFYEVIFIVRQDAASVLVESITGDITKIIKDSGGDVTKTEFCGVRQFAYPIKKNKKGHYVLLNVLCDGSLIAEIERRLRINENVLRYLSVLVDSLDNNPSALMQNRHYRENVSNWGDDTAATTSAAVVVESEVSA